MARGSNAVEQRWCARLFTLLLAMLLLGCEGDTPESNRHSAQLHVFGTVVNVDIVGAKDPRSLVREIDHRFQRMHAEWHAWKPGPLIEVNRAIANGEHITIDPALAELIEQARPLAQRSGQRFNPAIGGLVSLWGFHTDTYPVTGPAPSPEQIATWVNANPTLNDLSINDNQLSSSNPRVQLDFGGFAKGVAVDIAIDYLKEQGVKHAIVNAGGDLRAMGFRDGVSKPWRIGIRHPLGGWNSDSAILGGIEIRGDESVFTSGNYERYREHQSERWPHIIDPRDGMPVRHVASATVIARDGKTADAAATALVVAGTGDWRSVTRALQTDLAMLVDDSGVVYLTPAMADRVLFEESESLDVRRVP